jgi:hypothetical protein
MARLKLKKKIKKLLQPDQKLKKIEGHYSQFKN